MVLGKVDWSGLTSNTPGSGQREAPMTRRDATASAARDAFDIAFSPRVVELSIIAVTLAFIVGADGKDRRRSHPWVGVSIRSLLAHPMQRWSTCGQTESSRIPI